VSNRIAVLLSTTATMALAAGLLAAPGVASAACPPPPANTTFGIQAISVAGNVTITTAPAPGGIVDVSAVPPFTTSSLGIYGCAQNAGSVTISTNASVLSHDGDGIEAFSGTGAITINHSAGQILGHLGNGITAATGGVSNLTIVTAAGTDITSAAKYFAIDAKSGGGNVNVAVLGSVSEGEIRAATGVAGAVNVLLLGSVKASASDAVSTFSLVGQTTIAVGAAASVSAPTGDAIIASTGGGSVSINNQGSIFGGTSGIVTNVNGSGQSVITTSGFVTAGTGPAIDASTFLGANTVNINGGVVKSGGTAVMAGGAGDTTVNTAAGAVVSAGGPLGRGIQASSGAGKVTVNNAGTVAGGILALTGSGAASVTSSGTVTADGWRGIEVDTDTGAITIAVTGGSVENLGSRDAIYASSASGAITITTSAGTKVASHVPTDYAIYGFSNTGPVSITTEGKITDGGIVAGALTGGIKINIKGADTNAHGEGVSAATNGGPIAITTFAGGVVTGTEYGIVAASNNGGAVTIQTGDNVSGDVNGIEVDSLAGANDVVVVAKGTVKGGSEGIAVFSSGGGSVGIGTVAGTAVIGGLGAGIDVSADGPVTVITNGTVTGDWAVKLKSGGAGPVTYTDNANVTGTDGAILIGVVNGPATLTVNTVGTIVDGGSGGNPAVQVISTGLGAVNVSSQSGTTITSSGGNALFAEGGAGGVTITTAGLVSTTTPFGGNGVYGQEDGPTGNLTITTGPVTASTSGVIGINNGAGATKITSNGPVKAGGNGIFGSNNTFGSQALTVVVNADITAGGSGVDASTLGTKEGVSVTVQNGAHLSSGSNFGVRAWAAAPIGTAGATIVVNGSSVAAANGPGLSAIVGAGGAVNVIVAGASKVTSKAADGIDTAASSGPTTIQVGGGATVSGAGVGIRAVTTSGLITLTNAGVITTGVGAHAGLAISESGVGGLKLTNAASGLIDGQLTGADHVTFTNNGTWKIDGTSDFGTAAGAATNWVTNLGVIQVGLDNPAAAATASTLAHLGAFQNGGIATTGLITMVNGRNGDTLTVSGSFNGVTGHSVLAIDAFLGKVGSIADQLKVGGGTTGKTLIQVHDTNPGAAAVNPIGIPVVSGATIAANFAIDPASPNYDAAFQGVDHGFFVYTLHNVAGVEVLTSSVNLHGLLASSLLSAALDAFDFTSLETLLRGGRGFALGEDRPRIWMQASNWTPDRLSASRQSLWSSQALGAQPGLAGGAGMTRSLDIGGGLGSEFTAGAGYAQRTASLVSGVDLVRHRGDGAAWSLGLASGYVASDQALTQGQAMTRFDGAMLAVYADYHQGGFSVSGAARAHLLRSRFLGQTPGRESDGTVNTLGFEAQAAYRQPLGAGWAIEPLASVSVASASASDLHSDGGVVSFSGGRRAKASLGVRLTGDFATSAYRVNLAATARVWDEAHTETVATFGDDPDSRLANRFGGASGDFGGRLTAGRDGGLSAFIGGSYRVNTALQAASFNGGLALRW
jgi:hypothetical protein